LLRARAHTYAELACGGSTSLRTVLQTKRPGCSENLDVPREDVFLRRLEIYTAVAPLLEKAGVRGLTMRQAATAAHMSVGGLYHYFPSKRDLVLFVLSPDALQRLCNQPHELLAPLEVTASRAHLATFLEGIVRGVPFLRPAVLAAIELGASSVVDFVEATMTVSAHEFAHAVRAVRTDMGDAEVETLDRAVRHVTLGAMLDRSVTAPELRSELRSLVEMRFKSRARGEERQAFAS
jgi:AcrR family transcriptional regulator